MIFVSSWPALPTNGMPLNVFVGARSFADEHQIRVRIADAEDDLLAALRVKLASDTVADLGSDGRQRFRRAGVQRYRRGPSSHG